MDGARPVRLVGVRRWGLWAAGPAVGALVLGVCGLAGTAAAVGVGLTPVRRGQVLSFLVLLACAAACIEAVRRVGEPAGVAKDLLSAWTLPVALLLPPVYSLLAPLPLTALRQLRISRSVLHRRAYTVAAVGLANAACSLAFHRVDAAGPDGARHRALLVATAVACAALGCTVNVLLVAVAGRLAVPGTSWRELVGGAEQRLFDVGEICLGVVVAGCWLVTPALAAVMLLPVVLVQRSLSHAQLRTAARTDPKTGLLNAQAWQEEAEREIARGRRNREPVAVLIADLDHFKRVNDVHGHLVGDVVLRAAVAALGAGLRPYDQLGRFGGEEFTAVLPRTGRAEAARIAERLRRAVEGVPVRLDDGRSVEVTISIGVAVRGEHGQDLTDLLAAADLALYRAKQDGRNRVQVR